jgi:multimeric flavodoxin WrbA
MKVVAFNGSPRPDGNTFLFFLIQEMLVPGSCYWNMGFGRDKGEVSHDEEGLKTMTILGENMAWLLKKTR